MPSDDTLRSLQLYFGTLFLTIYSLPSFEEVRDCITGWEESFYEDQYANIILVLLQLLDHVFFMKHELLHVSKSSEYGEFVNYKNTSDPEICPIDLETSCLTFFEKLSVSGIFPFNEKDIEEITYCSTNHICKFEECTPDRVQKALDLLKKVRNHVITL